MKTTLVICAVLLVLPFSMSAGTLPDTGQRKCHDAAGNEIIPCPSSGQDFYGQDANYAPCNPHSYTSLSGGIMVQDNVTGLIWENKTDDGGIHDKDNMYNWDAAQSDFIVTLNFQNFGDHDDWRLPTAKELSSLVALSIPDPGPTINIDYFPNTQAVWSKGYWSSTNYADDDWSGAWHVDFLAGNVRVGLKSDSYYVRAVRGEQSNNNFINNGDITVTDTSTGLMWELKTDDDGLRDKDNTYTWQQALSYCENLSLADHDDWRLPNRNELQSIVDYSRYRPTIDPIFSNVPVDAPWYGGYCSSTTVAWNLGYAWYFSFYNGNADDGNKLSKNYVRAVRGGECGSLPTTTTAPQTSSTTTSTPQRICPTALALNNDEIKIDIMRGFRDEILSTTPVGREYIRLYYQWSPFIVRAMEEDEEFKQEIKELIEQLLPMIESMVQ